MRILCALGSHKWKDIYRLHDPIPRQVMMPVIPSLFAGPPYMAPTGIYYNATRTLMGRKCVRCGARRPA